MRRRNFAAVLAVLIAAQALAAPTFAQSRDLLVFAAASMKNALDDVARQWQAETGKSVAVSYAASSALAKQIEQGAPADLFISADQAWMDYLAGRKLIKAGTRVDLLGNSIVLVAAKDSKSALKIVPGFDLAGALGENRLAMADVDAVPAGKYGKAALETLGVWPSVAGRVAQAQDVRAALALVSRGEAPFGIVYKTDAAADPGVRVVDAFPAGSHPPIVYPAAALADAKNAAAAAAFLAYMRSAKARAAFDKQGFAVLD
jgi:molybdate transport system substrate-binding protein